MILKPIVKQVILNQDLKDIRLKEKTPQASSLPTGLSGEIEEEEEYSHWKMSPHIDSSLVQPQFETRQDRENLRNKKRTEVGGGNLILP